MYGLSNYDTVKMHVEASRRARAHTLRQALQRHNNANAVCVYVYTYVHICYTYTYTSTHL
jgi:hypothetical protein